MAGFRQTIVFAVGGPLEPSDLPELCDRLSMAVESTGATLVECDVDAAAPDAVTIDALARLQLAARRRACRIELRSPSPELLALLELAGLGEVLGA
jgi:ABC-type transporter Mla MlaB component